MKKVNKKAMLGMMMAMIFSLAVMQHLSKNEIQAQDINLQQISLGAGYMAGSTEGGTSGVWAAASGIVGGAAVAVGYGALVNSWNPAGWGGWAVAGGLAL